MNTVIDDAVRDTFISGITQIERLGDDCIRLTFHVEETPLFGGEKERRVIKRFVWGLQSFLESRAFIDRFLATLNEPAKH